MEIFIQAISIVAMAVAILSFQQRSQKKIVLFQLCSGTLFCIHFFLLHATAGWMLNLVHVLRSVVFSQCDKHAWARHKAWIVVFILASVAVCVPSFFSPETVSSPVRFMAEFFPIVGMVATTVAYREKNASRVRFFALISSPLWLNYNILHFSVGGILTEVFSLVSISLAMLRLDRAAAKSKKEESVA